MTAPVIRRSVLHRGRVVAVGDVTPRMRRITVVAPTLTGGAIKPAQDVEVWLRDDSGRRVKRRYTIRHWRPAANELDLDVLLHGSGPGSAWGASAAPGDELEFQGPRGKLELVAADWHLLLGDESALPAIATICAALPAHEPAIAVVEVGDGDDEVPFDAASLRWMHRGAVAAGGAELLASAVGALDLPAGSGHGYLMGETRAMVALRAVLEGRGIAHESIFVKGYWNIGRPDRIAGRAPDG
ncbi:MAG TPA: siderophore-interacting protein [Jatrophihabitantaceae bacterium]|nr:siderophore-interacting protein [Jatrophihabitantaceae bacterium]